ncbi:MAG TPA: ROK family protein [bacterium]|nr:ROK family protein [bacterium]
MTTQAAESLLQVAPALAPPLDPVYRPAVLGHRRFVEAVLKSGQGVPLKLGLERSGGQIGVFETVCFPEGHAQSGTSYRYAERLVKFLLWQRGGSKVYVAGPKSIADRLKKDYAPGGARAFDADFMAKVYERPSFEVVHVADRDFPKAQEVSAPVGRHLEGCRIGFDAGGSDRKVAAVIDGKEVFSCEVVWEPKITSDPQYHFDGIDDSIRRAAEHLPRIDAIGVSSAGIFIDNKTRVASLFRKVPQDLFEKRIKTIYTDIAKKWGDVPIEVCNDGDVTALAGAMSLNDQPVLGIAMGTSQAVGYVDHQGYITGWLNELAFAPVDYADKAPVDVEWSGDQGTGVNYFSQDAVIRLAPAAGIELDPKLSPGDKLKVVQNLLKAGDKRPIPIYESIGVYLGYALAHYAEFYELKQVLILGRVTSGEGGTILLEKAKQVLASVAPDLAKKVKVNLPDEASRRVGQAIAAASLPSIK